MARPTADTDTDMMMMGTVDVDAPGPGKSFCNCMYCPLKRFKNCEPHCCIQKNFPDLASFLTAGSSSRESWLW
jgi:hypothetical protein